MPHHLLTNFEIQKYYQIKTIFNVVYSRNNLSDTKYGVYVINLDEYESIETHWIALYVNAEKYVNSFAVEHILKEMRKIIGNENIVTNIYRIQACDSVMCGYFCIKLTDFMLKGKSLTEYTNFMFS